MILSANAQIFLVAATIGLIVSNVILYILYYTVLEDLERAHVRINRHDAISAKMGGLDRTPEKRELQIKQ